MDLKQLQKKTADLNSRFPHKFDRASLTLDLVEEVGELAQAILIVEKIKITNDPQKQKTVDDVANALGDILFDLLLLANEYGLDMETEYGKVLNELTARYGLGEFDGKDDGNE